MPTEKKISRRKWLTSVAVFAGTAGAASLLPCLSSAQSKASKSAVHYQDYPNQGQACWTCRFFIPAGGRRRGMMGCGMMGCGMMGGGMGPGMMAAGTCQVVEGRISPMGWCILYAPVGT